MLNKSVDYERVAFWEEVMKDIYRAFDKEDLIGLAHKNDAELEAITELMNIYNLGGWTDAIAPMKRALKAEADLEASRVRVK